MVRQIDAFQPRIIPADPLRRDQRIEEPYLRDPINAADERLGISTQRIEREFPQVPLVGDVGLKQSCGSGFVGTPICHGAGHGRCVLEAALGQEAADLEVRIDACLQAPIQLQDEPVAEDDRTVALLRARRHRCEQLA